MYLLKYINKIWSVTDHGEPYLLWLFIKSTYMTRATGRIGHVQPLHIHPVSLLIISVISNFSSLLAINVQQSLGRRMWKKIPFALFLLEQSKLISGQLFETTDNDNLLYLIRFTSLLRVLSLLSMLDNVISWYFLGIGYHFRGKYL